MNFGFTLIAAAILTLYAVVGTIETTDAFTSETAVFLTAMTIFAAVSALLGYSYTKENE